MNPVADDPGSLSRLHDLAPLPPSSWWLVAPAWYVLGGLLLTGLILGILAIIIHWRMNWYRRAGLAELHQIEATPSHDATALIDLSDLLKRVALVAYPRHQVASLTGTAWLRFLDKTLKSSQFSSGPGQPLADVYGQRLSPPTPELLQLARHWIRRHRRDAAC